LLEKVEVVESSMALLSPAVAAAVFMCLVTAMLPVRKAFEFAAEVCPPTQTGCEMKQLRFYLYLASTKSKWKRPLPSYPECRMSPDGFRISQK
jgi:hypothetical protein